MISIYISVRYCTILHCIALHCTALNYILQFDQMFYSDRAAVHIYCNVIKYSIISFSCLSLSLILSLSLFFLFLPLSHSLPLCHFTSLHGRLLVDGTHAVVVLHDFSTTPLDGQSEVSTYVIRTIYSLSPIFRFSNIHIDAQFFYRSILYLFFFFILYSPSTYVSLWMRMCVSICVCVCLCVYACACCGFLIFSLSFLGFLPSFLFSLSSASFLPSFLPSLFPSFPPSFLPFFLLSFASFLGNLPSFLPLLFS